VSNRTKSTNVRAGLLVPTALVLAAVAGCEGATGGVPPAPSGVEGMVTTPVFREDGTLHHPRADDDGDGIPNQDEIDGYNITVDVNGFAVVGGDEMLEVRHVTSDPRYYDSDGDGLSDGRERMVTSDPRRVDSDGDTLSDFDEVERYGTSPVSIDTDGDARGGDPENPRPPQFALFDAAELRLGPDPANPSGPYLPGRGATNPADADTDGDGLNDYDELHSGLRRATIAEVPTALLRLSPGTDISLGLNVVTTSGQDVSESYTTTRSTNQAVATSFSTVSESTLAFKEMITLFSRNSATAGCCGDIVSLRTETGVRAMHETRFEQTLSMDANVEYTHDVASSAERARALTATESVEVNGGNLRFAIDVVNNGIVPFRISDVTFGVYFRGHGRAVATPLTEITVPDEMILAPGAVRTVQLARTDIETETMYALMRDPSRIDVRIERYNLSGADGVDLAFREEDVRGRTAHLIVDFGDGRLIERDVASPGLENGRLASVARLVGELGLDYEATLVTDREDPYYAIRIGDLETELYDTPAPQLDEALPYTARSLGGPGSRSVRRGWIAVIDRRDPTHSSTGAFANLLEADVYPGDIVTLHYTEDLDRDGVPAVVERLFGSSDERPHSDRDGLSDYWEIYEGWTVNVVGVPDYAAAPSPASEDAEGDGLSDLAEAQAGSDPLMRDTDLDGLSDLQEQDPAYDLDATDDADSPELPMVTCVADMVVPTHDHSCWVSAPSADGRGRELFHCSELSDPRGDCNVYGVGRSDCRLHNYISVPVEIQAVTLLGNLHLDACRRSDTETYPCTLRTPLGVGPSCQVAVSLDEAAVRPADGYAGGAVLTNWAVIPCSAFFDEDEDGLCEGIRDTGTRTAPGSDPSGVLGQVHSALNGIGGLAPPCSRLQPENDPFMVLDIYASDPQSDLTLLTIRPNPIFGTTHYDFAPTADYYHREEIHNTCALRAEEITIGATDQYGFTTTTTCAWREGIACIP
jgi:hypothetical protein